METREMFENLDRNALYFLLNAIKNVLSCIISP